MSLLPLLFSAWWAELDRPHRLMDQHFGVGLYPDQLLPSSVLDRYFLPIRERLALDPQYRSLVDIIRREEGGTSTITADKDMFKVILDVQQFKPEEVSVKLIDRFVVVEAKHEEKRDEHGFVSRQFVRKYFLPEQVDADELKSNISSDGVLIITAPLKQIEQKPNERQIKIELTGKPALRGDTTGKTTTTEKAVTESTTENATTNEINTEKQD